MAKADKKVKKGNIISVDFEGVTSGGGSNVPDGEYPFKPVEVEKLTSDSSGKDYLSWKLQVTQGKYKGKTLYHNTSLQPQALFNLRNMLEALAYEIPDGVMDLDLAAIIEEAPEAIAVVESETYEGKDRSKVVDFLPIDGAEAGEEEAADEGKGSKGESKDLPSDDDLEGMDKSELEEVIDEFDLDVDPDDYPKLSKLRAAVIEKVEELRSEEGGAEEESKEEDKYTAEAIEEMKTKDLQKVIDDHDLDVDLTDMNTKKQRRAVLKALREADLLEE